jgi:hypothetical protein
MSIGFKSLPFDFTDCPELTAAYDVWCGWRGEKTAPSWTDVDLSGLPPKLLPFVVVVDTLDDGDFRYRFWGTGLSDLYGVNITGMTVSEATGEGFRQITLEQLNLVVTDQKPHLFQTVIEKSSGARVIKVNLRMPVMDHPDSVTKVISISSLERIAVPDHEGASEVWEAAMMTTGQKNLS